VVRDSLELGPDADLEPAFGVVLLDWCSGRVGYAFDDQDHECYRALPSGHPLACQAGKFVAA
jgi:hypothetical protein